MKLNPKIKYLAMDENKSWWGHRDLPQYDGEEWVSTGGWVKSAGILDLPTDIRPEDSLIDLNLVSTEIETSPAEPDQSQPYKVGDKITVRRWESSVSDPDAEGFEMVEEQITKISEEHIDTRTLTFWESDGRAYTEGNKFIALIENYQQPRPLQAQAAKPYTVTQLNAAREQLKGDILELLAAFETKTGMPVQRIEFATYEFPPTIGPADFMSDLKILL